MNLIMGDPVKAFMWQDHEAHITAHMSAAQEPRMAELLSMAPDAGVKEAALAAHVGEHLAFQYRREIEKQIGVPLPPPDEPLPDDVEVQLSKLVAEASERILQKGMAEQQQQQQEEQAQDPVLQMRSRELDIKEQDVSSRAQEREARLQLDMEKAKSRDSVERERIEVNATKAEDRIEADVFTEVLKAETAENEIEAKSVLEGTRMALDLIKENNKE
tara:strand:- start:68 stop:718 length:651 start_codon:yes stop_codon:yes gene_type:complete